MGPWVMLISKYPCKHGIAINWSSQELTLLLTLEFTRAVVLRKLLRYVARKYIIYALFVSMHHYYFANIIIFIIIIDLI